MTQPVIITCAITGSIHTPTMSPHLPITPQQIADEAINAARAGAAIIHLHARDPQTGMPSSDPDLFREILTRISGQTDAILERLHRREFANVHRRASCSGATASA